MCYRFKDDSLVLLFVVAEKNIELRSQISFLVCLVKFMVKGNMEKALNNIICALLFYLWHQRQT